MPLFRFLSPRLTGLLCALVVCVGTNGCGSPQSPGQVSFTVHASPPPDDALLSPLTDLRVTALELRDATTDSILSHARFEPTPAGTAEIAPLDLGMIPVSSTPRDLRMLALGAAGQQVLGLALKRSVSWAYGSEENFVLELRRPLFFFGGSLKMVAPVMPMNGTKPAPYFAPNQQIYAPLRDETRMRVIDPNSVTPLLSSYDRQFDLSGTAASPVTAAAGTFDGQAVLAANLAGKLHVVDTLKLEDQNSLSLNDALPVQSIVIDPTDKTATLLLYQKPPGSTGRVGRIVFLRDLAGLRGRSSDGLPIPVDIDASAINPIGTPISAAYTPDGSSVDVVISVPPVQLQQPNCTVLGLGNKTLLRRYDPQTGSMTSETALPYTTAVAYTAAGDQVLVQPCAKPAGAVRPGQVVIRKPDGSTPDRILSAPGTAELAVVGNALIAIGSQDIADSATSVMRATVRILEANATTWATSEFDLPAWQVPYRVSSSAHSVAVLFLPTDVLSYGIAVTPDRTRALVLLRVVHQTYYGSRGVYLETTKDLNGNSESCYVQFTGYTYHVVLVNLQNGAREQDYLVGVQNQSCTSGFVCDFATCADQGLSCFTPCNSNSTNPYLIGYQDGYIPSAASVLFGRR